MWHSWSSVHGFRQHDCPSARKKCYRVSGQHPRHFPEEKKKLGVHSRYSRRYLLMYALNWGLRSDSVLWLMLSGSFLTDDSSSRWLTRALEGTRQIKREGGWTANTSLHQTCTFLLKERKQLARLKIKCCLFSAKMHLQCYITLHAFLVYFDILDINCLSEALVHVLVFACDILEHHQIYTFTLLFTL